ncbi:MAG: hypothetical protein IT581_11145 [Verrucomicrobiales bacterium]|nr:hypothetical protein [Verrucomicrobiales bacterium]
MRIRPFGRRPQKLNDIELALPGGVLFSEGLINLLSAKGMELKSAHVSLRDSQGEAFTYGLVQASIVRNLHSDMFVEYPNYLQCAKCGTVKVLRPLDGKLRNLILARTHRDEGVPFPSPTGRGDKKGEDTAGI